MDSRRSAHKNDKHTQDGESETRIAAERDLDDRKRLDWPTKALVTVVAVNAL
jgi:hypothetical protein